MSGWSKEDLEEMCGDDIIEQLAFVSGCHKHKLINDKEVPDGWIIPDESLRKFAELIVRECASYMYEHYPHSRYEINYMRKHMGDVNWNKPIGVE